MDQQEWKRFGDPFEGNKRSLIVVKTRFDNMNVVKPASFAWMAAEGQKLMTPDGMMTAQHYAFNMGWEGWKYFPKK